MLYPRITPCLLIHNSGLYKSVKFREYKYLGDPINAVKIFNEKEVDEIMILDIDASIKGVDPDFDLIENLAFECRMPMCYGGGIKTVEQAEKIFNLGVEKIAISSAAIDNPSLISEIAERVGNQSVVVVLDVKKKSFSKNYEIWIQQASNNTGINPFEFVIEAQNRGAGEIVINSIDQDGTMQGFDLPLIEKIREKIDIPMTVVGGAGSLEHIGNLIEKFGIIGASAGSLFVFKGKYRAVLINYPSLTEKENLIKKYFLHE